MEEKFIYSKKFFVELVRMDNNFLYSKRNVHKPDHQIFAFELTPKIIEDIAKLSEDEES